MSTNPFGCKKMPLGSFTKHLVREGSRWAPGVASDSLVGAGPPVWLGHLQNASFPHTSQDR